MKWPLGPFHTRTKGCDHVMVRALDSHPKVVSWVLGWPFWVVTGPPTQCEVRMDHVEESLHILLVEKVGQP